ncbi:MAG: indolepyruvate oxidoreductase subunit beta [Bacillota bacterium]
MADILNILLVGVGGQGTILAAKVLATAALAQGLDVKMSEIHGMAQRGGSVITHVRVGEKVFSPLVESGEADIIVAFEELEALRYAHYLRPGGIIIVNQRQIPPLPVVIGAAPYPQEVTGKLAAYGQVQVIAAEELAGQAGNPRGANLVLLGALAARLPWALADWEAAIQARVPARFLESNLTAFQLGFAKNVD